MQENKITSVARTRTNLSTKKLLTDYEKQLNNLYSKGYREIPQDIEYVILMSIQHNNDGYVTTDKTPNPFKVIGYNQRYATLSWGLFDEMHENADTVQYSHMVLNTKTKKIIQFISSDSSDDYKVDPVVFALSIDPIARKYPGLTPYQYASLNPIRFVDIDGKEGGIPDFLNNMRQTAHAAIQAYDNIKVLAKVAATVLYTASEVEKKIDEHTTAAQRQSAVLTAQFFIGYGPEHNDFGPEQPITHDIANSKLTGEARNDFYNINKNALAKGDYKNIKSINKAYEFNYAAPLTGPSGPFTEGGNAQQFVGSATYSINLSNDRKSLEFSVYNETSEKSLLYHIPFVKNHTREQNPNMGTTSQTFHWTEPVKQPDQKGN